MPRLLLALFLAGNAFAAPVPKELKKEDDKARLTGEWVVTRLNIAGREALVTETPMRAVVFDGRDGLRTRCQGAPDGEWTVTLDPSASPKRMRWHGTDGRDYRCVYDLTPDGGLRIAIILWDRDVVESVTPGRDVTYREFQRAPE
jgi:uncharacterized protein (TIGR03067 family)